MHRGRSYNSVTPSEGASAELGKAPKKQVAAEKEQKEFPYLQGFLVVTLLVASLFLMGALFPEVRSKVTLLFDTEEPCRQKEYDLSADPALFVPLPEIQKIPSAHSSDTKSLLLLAGDCNGCSFNLLQEIVKIGIERGFSIHIIHQNKLSEKLKENLQDLGVSSFTQDTGSKIHKELNAVFSPRVYVVDQSFRLLSTQKEPGLEGALKTIEVNSQ